MLTVSDKDYFPCFVLYRAGFWLQIIFAREYTQAENQAWHVQHFCCWYCDTPLAGLRYIAQQNNPYCVQCFDRLYSKVRRFYFVGKSSKKYLFSLTSQSMCSSAHNVCRGQKSLWTGSTCFDL